MSFLIFLVDCNASVNEQLQVTLFNITINIIASLILEKTDQFVVEKIDNIIIHTNICIKLNLHIC